MRRFIPAICAFLFGQGVAGVFAYYEQTTFALVISVVAIILSIVLWVVFGIKKRGISELDVAKNEVAPTPQISEHLLWKMYLNINDLIRQLRDIAPIVFDDIKDKPDKNLTLFYEDYRVKNILTKIEIEMQDCIDSDLCELFQSLMEYELWCAQFAINPIASPDIKLERIHQRIRDRIIKLIKRG